MSRAGHAPAPWATEHDGHGGIYVESADGRQVGFVSAGPHQEGNAQLLRAAPNLLAACRWVANVVKHKTFCPAAEDRGECDCGLQRNVLDAIALATGKDTPS